MAEVTFQKGTEMFELFQDYWKIIQMFWEPEDNDAYWKDVFEVTNRFYQKYKSDFAKSLVLSLIGELERKAKKGGGTTIADSIKPSATVITRDITKQQLSTK